MSKLQGILTFRNAYHLGDNQPHSRTLIPSGRLNSLFTLTLQRLKLKGRSNFRRLTSLIILYKTRIKNRICQCSMTLSQHLRTQVSRTTQIWTILWLSLESSLTLQLLSLRHSFRVSTIVSSNQYREACCCLSNTRSMWDYIAM
jgi:hypothetical protein